MALLRKIWPAFKLLALFNKELFLSSYAVLRHVVSPRMRMQPGIVALETQLTSKWEVTLLSSLICLTPGTLTLDIAPDGKTLYIHAMDIEDAQQLVDQMKNTFERAIMEVSRA